MARTFVQQSQISGSLAFNDGLASGEGLAYKQTLVGDLDALRSQMNKIIGKTNWYDALDGSQDLADIYAAVHMTGANADFQGTLDVTGVATFDAAITGSAGLKLAGDLDVNSTADFQGAVNLQSTLTVGGASDLNGSLDVSGQVDLAAASVATNVRGTLSVAEVASFTAAITGSAGLKLAGDLDVNSSADIQGAVNLQSTLNVGGKADFAGIVDVAGTLSASAVKIDGDVAGRLYLVGSEGEIQDSDKLFFDGSLLQVTGSLDISGPITANDGLTVTGDRLEVTGSVGVTGAVDFDSTLNVDGAVTFGSSLDVTGGITGSAGLKIAGDADFNSSADFAGAVNLQGKLDVGGVADFVSPVYMADDLGVSGSLTVDGNIIMPYDEPMHLYLVGADKSITDESALWFDGSKLYVTGALEISQDLKVGGNDIIDGSDVTVMTFKGVGAAMSSVEIANNLEVKGDMFYAVSASFSGDVTVQGDLTIQGSMTYIDTENLKVKDALIHLNTGGNSNLSPRGLVLHGDQAYDDLAFGAKPASGDFVFAKEVDDSDVDAGNSDIFASAKLAAAWANEIKLGGVEGSLSGSLSATATGAELSSVADLSIVSADDLLLSGNGETAISFIAATEQGTFATNFPSMTLVGAVNELFDMIGGGSAAKGDLNSTNVAAGVLTFSSIGTLTAAEHKLIDVYLNGVLLSPSRDLSSLTTTTVALDSGIASGLMVDDVITVVIRSAV